MTKTNDEVIRAASSMTNSQAIDAIVDLLKQYKHYCRIIQKPPDHTYEIAVIKAVSCIGFADGFKRAYQETKSEVKQP